MVASRLLRNVSCALAVFAFGTNARSHAESPRAHAGHEARPKETPAADEARRKDYLRDVPLAGEALEKGDRDRVRELLARHVPKPGQADHRGWEWHYLDNLTRGQERVVFRAKYSSGVPVVSKDYRWLALSDGKQIALVDINAGKQVAAQEGRSIAPHSFTADGSAVWGHENENFVSWAVPSLKRLHSVSLTSRKGADMDGAVPSPDGGRVAIPVKNGEGKWEIHIVDAKTDKEVARIRKAPENFHSNSYWRPMWSRDGKRIVTNGRTEKNEQFTQVWDAATGELVFRVPGRVWPVAWGMEPTQLLVRDLDPPDRILRLTDAAVWDVATGKSVLTLRTYNSQEGVFPRVPRDLHRWTVDGGRVRMTGLDPGWSTKVVYTWDVATGNLLDIEPAPPAPGTREVEMGRGDNPEVRIYEAVQDRGAERVIWWAGPWARPDFSWRSATEFALGTLPRAGVWSAETDALRDAGAGWPSSLGGTFTDLNRGEDRVAWRPDGGAFIYRNEVWDAEPGRTKPRLKLDYTTDTYSYRPATAWAPDGKRVAAHWEQHGTNWLGIWNADTGARELKFATGIAMQRRVSWSPDGTWIVTQGEDYIRDDLTVARVWDAATGRLVRKLPGANLEGTLSWSPDGRYFSRTRSLTGPGEITVWDVTTGEQTVTHKTSGVTTLSWASDGKRVASSEQMSIDVISAATGKVLQHLSGTGAAVGPNLPEYGRLRAIAWSPDGERLAALGESHDLPIRVFVWDAKTGKRLATHAAPKGVRISPDWLAWDRAGKRLALAVGALSGWAGAERILTIDADTGTEARPTDAADRWWNPDDPRLTELRQNDTRKVMEVRRLGEVFPLGRSDPWMVFQDDYAYLATTSPDGKRVAWFPRGLYNGYPEPINERALAPRVFDAADGRLLVRLPHPDAPGGGNSAVSGALCLSAAWSADGKRVAGAHTDGRVVLWDAVSGKILWTTSSLLPKRPQPKETWFAVAWSTDGKRLALAPTDYDPPADHNFVAVLDAADGKVLTRVPGPPKGVSALTWSPDGKRVAVAAHDTTVRVWDATGREEFVLRGHRSAVTGLAWNPDGTRLATADPTSPGSKVGEVRIWDGLTGQELLTLRGHTQVAWSTDGRRLAAHGGVPTSRYERERHGKAIPTVIVWDAGPGVGK